ncbi:YccF domain-containing protein [Enorma massiliensis]|uniref:YccF domain-containing protein n=1 Tax=Enorma massiliensis TaxID=1472761 RepID=UPI003A901724
MSLIANIIWIIFGGLATALAWCLAGCILCITIIGIPLGLQAFKMARLTLAPFGVDIAYGGGAASTVANVVWLVLCGVWMALAYLILGCLYCVTIIGIPIGLQLFKMAQLSLLPFGAEVIPR